MHRTLTWQRLDNPTRERATIHTDEQGGTTIRSTIEGHYEGCAVDLDYTLHLRPDWSWEHLEVENRCGPGISLQRGADVQLDIPFVDFFLTPVTNTLPIRRLGLAIGERREIETVYFLPETFEASVEEQSYERLDETRYRFTSDGGAFTAVIEVDAEGWVTAYEKLFYRLTH